MLVDGDNAEYGVMDQVVGETSRFGVVTVKRVYGDWTKPSMNSWKSTINALAMRPIQKFEYCTGKNSSDTALIIDAMDLLHGKVVDGFCIVSSDSDYTGLATRIREEGKFVMGIGHNHTPEAFVKSCEKFVYVERLKADSKTKKEKSPVAAEKKKTAGGKKFMRVNMEAVNRAFNLGKDLEINAARFSRVSDMLLASDPSFDVRNFGFSSFKQFANSLTGYEVISLPNEPNSQYLRETQTASTR